MSKNSEGILLRLKPETKTAYQELAKTDRRPLAEYLRNLLEDILKDKQK